MRKHGNLSGQMTLLDSGETPPAVELDKPVSLIHISNNLTAHQRKAYNVLLILAKKQLEKNNHDAHIMIEIPWIEFKKLMHLKHRTQKHAIEKLRELQDIKVHIDILGAEGDRIVGVRHLSLLSEIRFEEDSFGDTLIKIFFPPTICERLANSDIRAVLNMTEMAELTSKFGTALYELCMAAFEGVEGNRVEFGYEISEFKTLMDIGKGYDRKYDLQKRCIEVAITEIGDVSDLRISYSLIKEGRGNEIRRVEFVAERVEKDDEETIRAQQILNEAIQHVKDGYEEHSQVIQAVEKYLSDKGFEYTVSNIAYTNVNFKKNYIKLLKDALENDYAINDRVRKQQEENAVKIKRDEEANIDLEEAEKQAAKDAEMVKMFELLPEEKKDDVYALIEEKEKTNFFFSKMSSVEQIATAMRELDYTV
jgi:plasmid replication initiation protein